MTNTVNILDKAGTLKTIGRIAKSTATSRDNIQAAVVGGLNHAAEHGDSTLLTKLVNAVSTANGTQLRKYIAAHAPLTWKAGKGFVKAKKGGTFDVAGALGHDWDTFEKAPRAAAAYDADKLRAKVQRQIEAAALEAAEAGDVVTANAIIAGLDALFPAVVKLAA